MLTDICIFISSLFFSPWFLCQPSWIKLFQFFPQAYTTSGTLLIHIRKAHNVNAKSVKDVFPVYNMIEDQKVFTIRSKPLTTDESVMVDMDNVEEPHQPQTEEEEALCQEEVVVEEVNSLDLVNFSKVGKVLDLCDGVEKLITFHEREIH